MRGLDPVHNSSKKSFLIRPLLLFLFLLLASGQVSAVIAQELKLYADPSDKIQVKHGQRVYQRICSLCHGANLEGQPNWRIRKPDSKLPTPPHDETGHTWHHADKLLFGMIKQGIAPPYAPANYKSDIPAWGDTLKDEDIWAVLAYLKSRWPTETRKFQAEINQDP